MKKKYWFTLVEMFAVVIILGILAGVGIWRLSTRNANRYKAEMCVNQIYGELSNIIHWIASSKTIKVISNHDEIPHSYQIYPYSENQSFDITISISSENLFSPQKKFINSDKINSCKSEKYYINLITKIETIELLPGLKSIGNNPGIKITNLENGVSDQTATNGELKFNFCTINWICEEFAKITLDRRSGILRKSFCQLYHTDDNPTTTDIDERKTCKQRSL